MKKITLAFAIIATVFTLSVSAQSVQEVQTKFKEAATVFNAKQYAQAIPLFEETISMGEMADGDVNAILDEAKKYIYDSNMQAGKQLAQKRQFQEALKYFKAAEMSTMNLIEKNNANKIITACYRFLVVAKIKDNDMAGAAAIANKGYIDNKKDIKTGILAAQCYSNAGNLNRALQIYNEIILLGKTPRYENAANEAKKSASKDILSTAIKQIKSKNYTDAIKTLDLSSAYIKNDQSIEMARIQAYYDTKNYAMVTKIGENTINTQKTALAKSNASFLVAISYQELKNNTKAIEFYKKVISGSNVETAKKLIIQLSK